MQIAPKDWKEFQHYKERNPPWIRLHKKLLDNFEFHRLPVASKALAPMLWLLASDSVEGVIDASVDKLSFRLRQPASEIIDALKPLIDKGFFVLLQDDSSALAECKQSAVSETETETETETLQRTEKEKKPPRKRDAPPAIAKPDDVEQQTWSDWLALRKAKKAPVTQTVLETARRESEKAGMALEAFLRVWCGRGSQGLEASWLKSHERPANGSLSFAQVDEQNRRKRWEEMTGRKWPDSQVMPEFIDVETTVQRIA